MPRKQYFTILISTFWFLYSFQPLFHDNLSKQLCKFVSRSYDLFRHGYLTTSAMEFTLVEESINPIKKALVGHPHNNWHYYTGEDIYLTGWCLISKNPAPYHQQKTWMLVFKATHKKKSNLVKSLQYLWLQPTLLTLSPTPSQGLSFCSLPQHLILYNLSHLVRWSLGLLAHS